MTENQFLQQGARGCFTAVVIVLLAICALGLSTGHVYPEHRLCGGMLGAGYPALFICDDWGGGSPSSSWGKITLIDIPNGGIRPTGFLVDFLFYLLLIWFIWFVTAGFVYKRVSRHHLWWVTFIGFGFVTGFLCAFVAFQSSSLYLRETYYYRTPTPFIPTPTPFGTPPSLITPIPTAGP